MELSEIVDRYAQAINAIDNMPLPGRINQRTKQRYLPGVKSMLEVDLIEHIAAAWETQHPSDFDFPGANRTQIPYPGQRRNKCDHVLTTDGVVGDPEWAVEAKYLHLVGDNGKRNDFAVTKALSPYLKDRSLYHDVVRLRETPMARRQAVIVISFNYSSQTCEEALRLHPSESERVHEIAETCRTNGGTLSVKPLIDFADGILRVRQLVQGSYTVSHFNAPRHPCGGTGVVVGWEILTNTGSSTDDW